MTVVARTRTLTAAELDELRHPRRDLLREVSDGVDAYIQDEGPFEHYRRTIVVATPVEGTGAGDTDERSFRVTETTDFRLAIPVWRFLFTWLMKRAIAEDDRTPRKRWWWGMDIIPERTTRLMSVIALLSVVVGYLGVVIGQTLTFATEEFGAGDDAQGTTLAGVRIGVLLSVVFLRFADRVGRKPLLIWFTTISVLLTALGAFSPDLRSLGVSQALARGLATGLLTLITLAVTEEVPAAIRSRSIGLITLSTGLGAGMVVWVLPLADTSPRGWRIIYLIPLIALPLIMWAARSMPETRRFDAASRTLPPGRINRRWFILLAVASFASASFLSPASQFMNEYLNDELGYSASSISVFRLLVYSPIAVFVLGAGVLADRIGRRPIGAIGLAVGAIGSAVVFFSEGVRLWLAAMAGAWFLAGAYTALRGYQTELFPTRARARVGGWLDGISVTGSALGLLAAGWMSEHYGRLGPGMAILLVGPIIVMILLITMFPETANIELEDLNPDDPSLS